MVKKDDYSVSLVNAETKAVFREHIGPDDKVYVEVEPNAEYWIRVQYDGRQENVELYCEFEVDEKDLGFYYVLVTPRTPSDVGIWSKIRNQTTEKAFTVKMISGNDSRANGALWMGTVKVDFYESVKKGPEKQSDFVSPWMRSGPANGSSAGKKAVASKVGTRAKATDKSSVRSHYVPGALLKSITLHYCTAVGLIHVGVLAKPATWDYHRMQYPADTTASTTRKSHLKLEPETMTVQTCNPSGDVVGETSFLLFDFTKMDESSDDDSDDEDDD